MSLLSTPSTGSWSRLLYLLSSHFLVPPPPPLPSPLPLTLGTLDDDSLLLLFSTLALPPLLTLRGVSRRFAYLIQRYTLPQFRTFLYGYSAREGEDKYHNTTQPQVVDLFTSRSVHPYTDFCRGLDYFYGSGHVPFYRQPRQVHPTVLATLPASLPRLLPNLSSLTFTCYNSDPDVKLTEECLKVNRLLSGYLQSWATTLVSLHLYLEKGSFLDPPKAPFPLEPLSQLVALRYLYLQQGTGPSYGRNDFSLLPDSLPVLGQLNSFSLHYYAGPNTALLLGQLGPNLDFLSLNDVKCSVADFGAFLRDKPTYRRTLKTLEISLQVDDSEIPVVGQFLSSLERLCFYYFLRDNLRELLFNLCRLPALRELSTLGMSLEQLRALRDNFPREELPRLSSLRTLDCRIESPDPVPDDFTPEELFNTLLPLLARIFAHLERLTIDYLPAESQLNGYSVPLSEELDSKAKASFPHLLTCKASYYV